GRLACGAGAVSLRQAAREARTNKGGRWMERFMAAEDDEPCAPLPRSSRNPARLEQSREHALGQVCREQALGVQALLHGDELARALGREHAQQLLAAEDQV